MCNNSTACGGRVEGNEFWEIQFMKKKKLGKIQYVEKGHNTKI